MSEENELRVKFVIDDTDFRNQLDQLRGDLERKQRLEPDVAERPSSLPPIDISIGRVGMDGDLVEELRQMRSDIDNLERRSGLPNQFKELTLNDLNNMVIEATQSPAWISTVSAGITERLLTESAGMASRSYADVTMGDLVDDTSRSSAVGAGLRMYRASLLSGREELIGAGRGGGRGLDTQVTELESFRAKGPRVATGEAFETVAHSVIKGLGRTFLTGSGKYETASEVFKKIPGFKKIFDIFSPFYGTSRGGVEEAPAFHIPEAKTGRITGDSTVTQVAEQIMLGLGLLQRDYGLTLHDIASDPEVLGDVAGYASRLTSTVISLESHTPDEVADFEAKVISKVMGYWKSSMAIMGEEEEDIASAMGVLRTVFSSKGVSVGVLVMSPKMRKVMADAADEASGMSHKEQAQYVGDKVRLYLDSIEGKKDYDIWYGKFNPTFSEGSHREIGKKMADARKRIADMIASGTLDRPKAESRLRGVITESVRTGGAFGAAYAAADVFGGGSMGGLPSIGDKQITSRVGRHKRPAKKGDIKRRILDPRFLTGLVDMMEEEGEGVTDEEVLEAVAVAISGPLTTDYTASDRRAARIRLPDVERSISDILTDPAMTEPLGMITAPGSMTENLASRGRADRMTERSAGGGMLSIMTEERERLSAMMFATGGLPMELDWQKFMGGLGVYAKELRKDYEKSFPMSGERYLQWLVQKGKGGLPGDMTGGVESAMNILKEQGVGDSVMGTDGNRLVSTRLLEFMGNENDPLMPVTQNEINFVRSQLTEIREKIITGKANFNTHNAGIITRVANELEAFERMYTKLAPATSISIMRWS